MNKQISLVNQMNQEDVKEVAKMNRTLVSIEELERPYVFRDDIPPYQHRNSKYFTEIDAFNVAEMIAHEDDTVKAILQYMENCRDEEEWLYLK